jgi:mRNA interferase HigB
VVNVISATTIKRFAALHADAAEELMRWNKTASRTVWRDLNDVRRCFPGCGSIQDVVDLQHPHNYRLIVKVDYWARLVMVKEFLTHNEYVRGGWKKWAR